MTAKDICKRVKKETGCSYRCKGFNNYLKGNSSQIKNTLVNVLEKLKEENDNKKVQKLNFSFSKHENFTLSASLKLKNKTVSVFYIN